MAVESLLVWLLIGAIAGWLAGLIVKGYGFGLVGNIIIGIVGSLIGGWLFRPVERFAGQRYSWRHYRRDNRRGCAPLPDKAGEQNSVTSVGRRF